MIVPGNRIPFFTLFILLVTAISLYMFWSSHAGILLTLTLSPIALIIFGEHCFNIDDALESHGLPGREAIIPVISLCVALALGVVSSATIVSEFHNKIGIIALILSFAIVSEGIARSGYFTFAAYKIVSKCDGNTARLTLYMYLLSSVLAFLTSNDIVILVLTPVIISICVHARIRNTRLLLLSQFVAANTMAMGTLIGSPTNIIFGYALNINFFSYLLMMVVPAFLCGMLSLIVVNWINNQSRPDTNGIFVKRWAFEETYRIPASIRYVQFTPLMKTWLILFASDVALLALISSFRASLLWAAIPIALSALYFLYAETQKETRSHSKANKDIREVLQFLPYSIFFFGIVFFTFSAELARLDIVQQNILPFVRAHLLNDVVHASFGMLGISALLVNTMNDLPASAFLADILHHINASDAPLNEYLKMVVEQAILVGLNIGCYLTPIGALAGIMWFNIIHREERRQQRIEKTNQTSLSIPPKMLVPSRGDMVGYGFMHFIFIAFFLGYLLPFFVHILDLLISSPGLVNETALPGLVADRQYLPYIGITLLLVAWLTTRNVLRKSGVFLGHVREIFSFMTRLTIWTMKNRLLYLLILGATLLALASALLYWAEISHERVFGANEGRQPLFDSFSSFFIWILVYSGAGLTDAYKPHSALGMVLTSILPVLVVGGIVLVVQLSSEKTIQQLARRMAVGDTPGYRIVIINFRSGYEKFVETLLSKRGAIVLLLCAQRHYDRAESFCARLNVNATLAYRAYAALKHVDASHAIDEYRIDHADEIYLLADASGGEYDEMRYVSMLDSTLTGIYNSLAEGIMNFGHDGTIAKALDIENLDGIPKIFIETSSERFRNLVQRTCSPLFLRTAVQIKSDHDISDLLMSDMDESMAALNLYYRLGQPVHSNHIFREGGNPLAHSVLRDFELDRESKKLFRNYFSGSELNDPNASTYTRESSVFRQNSVIIRMQAGEKTRGARFLDGQKTKEIDDPALFGVVADVGGSRIHFSISSVALSVQATNVEKVILKRLYKTAANGDKFKFDLGNAEHRLFIFNISPLAQAFVRKILPLFAGNLRLQIVLLGPLTQYIPEDIKKNPHVHVLQSSHVEELVQQICPSIEERRNIKSSSRPILQKGDRIYGFMEQDDHKMEADSIDFIDRLDMRLRQIAQEAKNEGVAVPVSRSEVYIATETVSVNNRLILENFSIDKIIDTSIPKISYMEILAKLFHRTLSDKSQGAETQGNVYNFRRAAEIAEYLCHFVVAFAEDVSLKDDLGTEIRLLGKSMNEAATEMRAYSIPPVQLFARARVELEPYKANNYSGYTFHLNAVPDNEPIQKGDLLLNIPVI